MLNLKNFVGNRDLVNLLQISIEAARRNNRALPHILLKGPAGTGKTSLSEVIAQEFGVKLAILPPGTAKDPQRLREFFLKMPEQGYDSQGKIIGQIQPQIVFCDECHQLSLPAQENLGIAMQDWRLPVRVNNSDCFEWVPNFTLVGATTLAGKLSKPFLDRFKIPWEFQTYSFAESLQIIAVQAQLKKLQILPGVAEEIAKRSRGVARLMVRYLERLSDAAMVGYGMPADQAPLSMEVANHVFGTILRIDEMGLSPLEIKVMAKLASFGQPVGVETIAAAVDEDKGSIQQHIEPYLMRLGFLLRTKRGRLISEQGRKYLQSKGYLSAAEGGSSVSRLVGEKV